MVNFFPLFVNCSMSATLGQVAGTITTFAICTRTYSVQFYQLFMLSVYLLIINATDHIDYIKQVAGVDYIGVGSDYDGIPT